MREFHYERLEDQVRTVEDLQDMGTRLDLLLVSLFQAGPESFAETLSSTLPPDLAHLLEDVLREQNVSLTDREMLQQFFHGLKNYLLHLPILQLTVAYRPSGDQVDQLSSWIRKATGTAAILHLHHDPRVLGGAIVAYSGKYADVSLKKRLESVYKAKKPEILAMLQSK